MKARWWEIIAAMFGAAEKPVRPKVVEDELAKDYGDVEQYKREQQEGKRDAPPDAEHIEEGGI